MPSELDMASLSMPNSPHLAADRPSKSFGTPARLAPNAPAEPDSGYSMSFEEFDDDLDDAAAPSLPSTSGGHLCRDAVSLSRDLQSSLPPPSPLALRALRQQ